MDIRAKTVLMLKDTSALTQIHQPTIIIHHKEIAILIQVNAVIKETIIPIRQDMTTHTATKIAIIVCTEITAIDN